jgi:AcrR family transcriptional regulator
MRDKRSQGRPSRGGNEVGSDRIAESLREMLRSGQSGDASRKSLAEYAGVTPALITYYFPNKDGLIEHATKPIMEEYARQLQSILSGGDEPDSKLKQVISLLVGCYERDAGILDAYSELVRTRGDALKPNYIDVMSQELSKFLTDWFEKSSLPMHNCAMMQGALWGMCQFVAQIKSAREAAMGNGIDEIPADLEVDRVTPIYDLMKGGLDRWAAFT